MFHRWLWLILAVALALRVGLLAAGRGDFQCYMTPDSRDYLNLAEVSAHAGSFTSLGKNYPEIFRTPGYPAFLAPTYAIAEAGVLKNTMHIPLDASDKPIYMAVPRALILALAAQILLDVALCWLVFLLGSRLYSERVGLWAAAIQAVFPVAIASSCRLLTESLFAFVLTLGILLLVAFLQGKRNWLVIPAGLLLGLACLIRPIGLPFVFLSLIVLIVATARRGQTRRLAWAVVFLLAAAAPVTPWVVRNYRVTHGEFLGLSSAGDYNLYFYEALPFAQDARLTMTADQRAPEWLGVDSINPSSAPKFIRSCRREGLSIIGEHPIRFAAFHLRTTMNVFIPPAAEVLEICGVTTGGRGTLAVLQKEGIVAAVRHYFDGKMWAIWLALPVVLVTLVIYLAAAVGVIKHFRLRMGAAGWLVAVTILYFVLIPGPAAHARFLAPVAPLLAILAAAGIAHRRDRGERREGKGKKRLSKKEAGSPGAAE